MLKFIVNKLIGLTLRQRVNVFKTIVVNFMLMPFKQALHFPIYIYGPCKLGRLRGKVSFLSPIKTGMFKIGISDPERSFHCKSFVDIEGKLEVGNNVVLRRGINLSIKSKGHVILEDDVYIGDNNTVISFEHIRFCHATRVGNNSVFMDSDFHYVININTREVKINHKPIEIGDNCWIGGWCTIKKGTKLPKGTIVAGPYAMTSKDYTKNIAQCSLIAGSPAKLIIEGMRRVNNTESDVMIAEFYKKNEGTFILHKNVDIDEFCMPKA